MRHHRHDYIGAEVLRLVSQPPRQEREAEEPGGKARGTCVRWYGIYWQAERACFSKQFALGGERKCELYVATPGKCCSQR